MQTIIKLVNPVSRSARVQVAGVLKMLLPEVREIHLLDESTYEIVGNVIEEDVETALELAGVEAA